MSTSHSQDRYTFISHTIADDGVFPNNANLPLQLVRPTESFDTSAVAFEELFARNGWTPAWRGGIFSFHHYHSTAHEVLGCFSGCALLQFGGGADVRLQVQTGDVVIIPAGVAHKCINSSGFSCVGAYPVGQSWDTCDARAGERPAADQRIAALGPWEKHPVGPMP